MNIETLRDECLSLPGVEESFPFDAETLVFKVQGKMFAVLPLERPDSLVLKVHPDYAQALRAEYAGITEAWHFNKAHWCAVGLCGDVPEVLVHRLVRHAYDEVLRLRPKKWQVAHFAAQLPPSFFYEHLNTTDSVMNRLRHFDYDTRPEEFVLLEADFQKAGRGQRGTKWESDSAKNLLFGLRLRPVFLPPSRQFALSQVAALAVAEALDYYATGIAVKWPNDIYWYDDKICGMLLEHNVCGGTLAQTLIGPGINVNQLAFHGDAPNPVSLFRILGREVNRYALLRRVLDRFLGLYDRLRAGEGEAIDRLYHDRLYRRDELHTYEDAHGRFRGFLRGVLPDGRLVVEDEAGRRRKYAFKEVKYIAG